MKSQIVNVRVDLIDANPYRSLKKYPFVKDKLDALQRSIADVGLWEGVIARKVGRRYELAFGHHRVEAARRSKLKTIHVIVRDLDDEEMIQFMGRENLEDYNADFLCMLESWEAASSFLAEHDRREPKNVEIASLLGWTALHKRGDQTLTHTAMATAAASKLMTGGYLSRDDLTGISVRAAREVCSRALTRMEQLERMGRKTARPKSEIETAKRQVGKGAKQTIKDVKGGGVSQKDIRGRVDVNTYAHAKKLKKRTPLFEQFGKALADQLDRILSGDSADQKIDDICKAANQIELDSDALVVGRVHNALLALEGRAGKRADKLAKATKRAKVTILTPQSKRRAQ